MNLFSTGPNPLRFSFFQHYGLVMKNGLYGGLVCCLNVSMAGKPERNVEYVSRRLSVPTLIGSRQPF